MKLIFLSSLVPVANPKSGYEIANKVIVDALKALDIDMKIIGFLTPGETPAYPNDTIILDELEVTNTKVGRMQKAKWLLKAILAGTPVSVGKMLQIPQHQIEKALDQLRPFDGLILNSVQLPGAFIKNLGTENSIFVAHNVEAQSAEKNAQNASNFMSKLLFNREARLLKKIEHELCLMAKHVWTLSDEDRRGLGVEHKSSHLPLVTSIAEPKLSDTAVKNYDFGMIGSWSWAANRKGLDWFFDEVLPHLSTEYSIAIAGNISDIPPNLPSNIKFLGRVESAHSFTNSCRVIPLISREGTGVQLKTIETFELGLPCVATKSSLRGLNKIPENCTLADDGEKFADALSTMVAKIHTGERLSIDGGKFHRNQSQDLLAALKTGIECIRTT